MSNFSTAGDLLNKVEKLRTKNRDLLSVEDVQVLDDCIKTLKELKKLESTERSEEVFEKALKVIFHLLKLFTDADLF